MLQTEEGQRRRRRPEPAAGWGELGEARVSHRVWGTSRWPGKQRGWGPAMEIDHC